jgi:hypothetical protein
MGPHWHLSDDLKKVTVSFPTSPPCQIELDAASLDTMLQGLAGLRAAMAEQIPHDFALGQKVHAVPDPQWLTEPELMHGDTLFHVRHPAFGWLSFLFPKPEARSISQLFAKQAEQQDSGDRSPHKPN